MHLAERPGVFFLDSALRHECFGRYSFIGCEPAVTIEAELGRITVTRGGASRSYDEDPFEALRGLLAEYGDRRCGAREAACDIPFTGGFVGYLGYDLRHFIERLPSNSRRDQRFPDMRFSLYEAVLCHDNARGEWWLCGEGREADRLREAVGRASEPAASGESRICGPIRSNFKKQEYLDAVRRVIEYILAGDIFQANLSQRYECEVSCSAREVYSRLRAANAAPFGAYIEAGGGRCVMSTSPERFLKVDGRRVETRPIKGTRPRMGDEAADAAMRRELLASEKDNAELAMIIDLERNDLGRVCEFGTVKVDEARTLETYATVHHLVGTVSGMMRKGCDVVDILRATFPGGSITGAPKIRAMEIIDEMEPTARGVYTGGIGYIGLDGRADFNIAIRTALMDGERLTFQVGGGIVADSEPEAEYEETVAKGLGIVRALGARQIESES